MIKLRIEPRIATAQVGAERGVELALPPGERLLDALDDAQHTQSALPTSCRAANCGRCLVRVLEGGTKLAPASPRERALLRELDADDDMRLGCQIHVEHGATGAVVLRVAGDSPEGGKAGRT
jgi:ferredoxin